MEGGAGGILDVEVAFEDVEVGRVEVGFGVEAVRFLNSLWAFVWDDVLFAEEEIEGVLDSV
jgi:hypothetical protein